MHIRARAALGIGALAALLAGCGGGGGTNPTPSGGAPASLTGGSGTSVTLPPVGSVNAQTTYTVYSEVIGGTTQVGIAPVGGGTPSSDPGWTVVTGGAEVFYPDGSVQLTDALGNFDASQSSWALANQSGMAANANAQPEVYIALLYQTSVPAVPLDTTLIAYAPPGSPVISASRMRSAQGMRATDAAGGATNELASVQIFPRGVAMFDNESRAYSLIGTDSDGQYVDLSQATVTWSLGGCGKPGGGAGQITQFKGAASKASYKPPSSGTFSTPDVVTATISANGSVYCSSANAYYYDTSSGVAITGTLNDSTNKPVPNGIVAFYGGGREFYRGNLVAFTDSTGKFARTLPPNRTMNPVGGQSTIVGGRPSNATYFTLTPSTITAWASGSTIGSATAPQAFQETSPFVNPFKPLPPVDRAIRDAYYLASIGFDYFPFNRPGATGVFQTCSIDAIVNNQANSKSCAKVATGDYFTGWSVTYLPSATAATSWIFQQPSNEEGGRHLLQIEAASAVTVAAGVSDATSRALATCTSTTPCFTYQQFYNPIGIGASVSALITSNAGTLSGASAGTILGGDGGFNETVGTSGAFTVAYTRNEYSVGHQVQGAPLYVHTETLKFADGQPNTVLTASNAWYNASGLQAGTLQFTRTPGTTTCAPAAAGCAVYTLAGTGTRTYYKGATQSAQVAYTIAGQHNSDRTQNLTFTVTSNTDPNAVNTSLALNYITSGGCPSGYPAAINGTARICGSIANPNVTGLSSAAPFGNNVVAVFTADSASYANVLPDPNLGGQPTAFHL